MTIIARSGYRNRPCQLDLLTGNEVPSWKPRRTPAARHHNVLPTVTPAELYLYADKGYVGGARATLLTAYKGRNLPDSAREANRCHAAVRANGERGFAVLKSWKAFDRFRGCPRQVGTFARAVLTLEHGP